MQTLWKTLLSRLAFSDAIIGADEACRWGRAQWHRLDQLGLLRETSPATVLRCQECEEQCSQDVAYTDDGRRAYLSCPRGYTVNLAPEQVQRWLVDPDALARLLQSALELPGDVEQPAARVWWLGRRVLAGRYRDFLLATGDSTDAAVVITQRYAAPILFVQDSIRADRLDGVAVFCLQEVSSIVDGGLAIDVDYIADSLPRDPAAPKVSKICAVPIPDGAKWEDVRIEVGESVLRILIGGRGHKRSLVECGLADGRKETTEGDRSYQLLRLFAARHGRFNPRDFGKAADERALFKHQASQLRKRLRDIVPIAGDPIASEKKSGEYRCLFAISIEEDSGFPTPHGAAWPDFEFAELPGGRVRVTVRTKERFSARARELGTDRTVAEVAERDGTMQHEFPLERLGLTSKQGIPTDEGRAFLELLRGQGKLRRRADDFAVLRLNKQLMAWTCLETPPLLYGEQTDMWRTYFICGRPPNYDGQPAPASSAVRGPARRAQTRRRAPGTGR